MDDPVRRLVAVEHGAAAVVAVHRVELILAPARADRRLGAGRLGAKVRGAE
jgi:hypothetical protein